MTLSEAERNLTALIGYSPGQPPTSESAPSMSNPLVEQGLRTWVELMGVPTAAAQFDPPYKLATSWNNPAYLARWAAGARQDEAKGKRRARPVSWDGDSPSPEPAPRAPAQPLRTSTPLDETTIAKIVDDVIRPRLENARKDLERSAASAIALAVADQVEKAALSARIREDIIRTTVDAAERAAADYMRRITPHALEVKTSTTTRILPAEARHFMFDEVLMWLSRGRHVYLVGGAGSGKTHMFKQLCVGLGFDLETQFFPIDTALTKYDVKGYKNPTGEYVATLVYRAMKFGGLMCIDEGDMWAAAALGALNSGLANDFAVFGDEVVRVHPDFRCIVAANTYGSGATQKYVGRNPLDAASLDRFIYLDCPYDPDLELQIFGDQPFVRYVHKVRAAIDELKLGHIVSMRAIQRGLDAIDLGFDAPKVCLRALWRNLESDTIKKIVNLAGTFTLTPSFSSSPESREPGRSSAGLWTKYDQFKAHINEKSTVSAVRIWREVTGAELHIAKRIVDDLIDGVDEFDDFDFTKNPGWRQPASEAVKAEAASW